MPRTPPNPSTRCQATVASTSPLPGSSRQRREPLLSLTATNAGSATCTLGGVPGGLGARDAVFVAVGRPVADGVDEPVRSSPGSLGALVGLGESPRSDGLAVGLGRVGLVVALGVLESVGRVVATVGVRSGGGDS